MKDETIQIRIKKSDKETLADLSKKLDIPVAQIIREAVKDRIATLTDIKEKEVEPASV